MDTSWMVYDYPEPPEEEMEELEEDAWEPDPYKEWRDDNGLI